MSLVCFIIWLSYFNRGFLETPEVGIIGIYVLSQFELVSSDIGINSVSPWQI